MSDTQKPVFEIGLVLAGAVSAGAYTAGVIDFLFEALDRWTEAKARGENVPQHDVKIRVISGASAGGMTAAIAAASIYSKLWQQPSPPPGRSIAYRSWVEKIDITGLLGSTDMSGKNGSFYSLLDSTVIDQIADTALNVNFEKKEWRQLPYICDSLKLYVTLSNLRGLPYAIKMGGETGLPFGMYNHMDYHYMEISRKEEGRNQETGAWENLKAAAIATGAFPVGLSPRIIKRKADYYDDRLNADGSDLSPFLQLNRQKDREYDFIAVDGGMLNNEPIELAEAALFGRDRDKRTKVRQLSDEILELSKNKTQENQDNIHTKKKELAREASSAVIVVDPFPTFIRESEDPKAGSQTLMRILGPIVNALMAQSLFRPKEILRAANDDVINRFLIAPVRQFVTDEFNNPTPQEKSSGQAAADKYPIASGFLGGFGGFLSEAFRRHDYELGRRNCQRFLQKYFTLDFEVALAVPALAEQARKDQEQLEKTPETSSKDFQIIPLVGTAKTEEQGRNNYWPTYSQTEKKQLLPLLEQRLESIATTILPGPFKILYKSWVVLLIPLAMFLIYFFSSDGLTGYEPVTVAVIGFLMFGLVTLIIGRILLHKWLVAKTWSMLEKEMNDYGLIDKTESKV